MQFPVFMRLPQIGTILRRRTGSTHSQCYFHSENLLIAKISMDSKYYDGGIGARDGSVEISNSSPGSGFPVQDNELPTGHHAQRIPQSLLPNANDRQLLPPMFPIWPSSLTNPECYSKAAPVTIPLLSTPLIKSNGMQLPVIQAKKPLRKRLADSDRRGMCRYHDKNPSLSHTELGGKKRVSNVLAPVINSCIAIFGVERRYESIYSLLNLLRSYFQHRFQDPPSERKVSLSRRL
jgi:hypothetical protein